MSQVDFLCIFVPAFKMKITATGRHLGPHACATVCFGWTSYSFFAKEFDNHKRLYLWFHVIFIFKISEFSLTLLTHWCLLEYCQELKRLNPQGMVHDKLWHRLQASVRYWCFAVGWCGYLVVWRWLLGGRRWIPRECFSTMVAPKYTVHCCIKCTFLYLLTIHGVLNLILPRQKKYIYQIL